MLAEAILATGVAAMTQGSRPTNEDELTALLSSRSVTRGSSPDHRAQVSPCTEATCPSVYGELVYIHGSITPALASHSRLDDLLRQAAVIAARFSAFSIDDEAERLLDLATAEDNARLAASSKRLTRRAAI